MVEAHAGVSQVECVGRALDPHEGISPATVRYRCGKPEYRTTPPRPLNSTGAISRVLFPFPPLGRNVRMENYKRTTRLRNVPGAADGGTWFLSPSPGAGWRGAQPLSVPAPLDAPCVGPDPCRGAARWQGLALVCLPRAAIFQARLLRRSWSGRKTWLADMPARVPSLSVVGGCWPRTSRPRETVIGIVTATATNRCPTEPILPGLSTQIALEGGLGRWVSHAASIS